METPNINWARIMDAPVIYFYPSVTDLTRTFDNWRAAPQATPLLFPIPFNFVQFRQHEIAGTTRSQSAILLLEPLGQSNVTDMETYGSFMESFVLSDVGKLYDFTEWREADVVRSFLIYLESKRYADPD